MKPSEGKAIYKSCKDRGYVESDNVLYPPDSIEGKRLAAEMSSNTKNKSKSLKSPVIKSGWVDDYRNIRNKEKQADFFIRLVKMELNLEVWPEFHFLIAPDPDYRFDYAIPAGSAGQVLKIAVEVEGGIWARGNSGHSSGKGIERDMKKSTLANVNGWTLIRCTPAEIKNEPGRAINLIKKAISSKQNSLILNNDEH